MSESTLRHQRHHFLRVLNQHRRQPVDGDKKFFEWLRDAADELVADGEIPPRRLLALEAAGDFTLKVGVRVAGGQALVAGHIEGNLESVCVLSLLLFAMESELAESPEKVIKCAWCDDYAISLSQGQKRRFCSDSCKFKERRWWQRVR